MPRTDQIKIKEAAWEIHMKKCERGRAWAEIMIYRTTGRSSSFYLQNKSEAGEALVDELDVCCIAFIRLLAEGRLQELEEHEGFKLSFTNDATTSDKFKAYLDAFQAKNSFSEWNYEHMIELRYSIYQVIHREQTKRKRVSDMHIPGE
jgi:hypothetical protein